MKKSKNKTPLAIRIVAWLFPKLERIAPSLANRYFIHIFFTPFHYKEPEKEKEFLKSARQFEVQLTGKRIQCYRWGDTGPRIMLVHGWAGRTGQFRAIIPALVNAGFQAVAFDGPAHGRSDGKQTNIMEFAGLIQQLNSEDGFAGIIGHSFGGIAALYGVASGIRIPKLIMISSPTLPTQVLLNFRHAINGSENVGKAIDAYLLKNYNKSFAEFSGIHAIARVKDLDLLLVQDKNDPEVAPENATELQKAYPPAKIHFTEGLGHTRILRDEAAISRCIQFLKA